MKLPEFILGHNRVELESPVILQTGPPYAIVKIRMEKDEDDLAQWLSTFEPTSPVYVIPGYNVALYLAGFLSLHKLGSFNPEPMFKRMAEFYKSERLEYKPGFYKKYAK